VDTAADRFAATLLANFAGRGAIDAATDNCESGLSDRIAGREIEILALVGGGLRNREIGNRLGLTEGTVKWYMQQIYDKLGVRRRPQAVMRARALGLLN
jgi:LuxR family maltose regulon positive regulatory protein